MTAATIWLGERTDGLTREDVHNLNAVLGQAMADNTKANYRSQWRRFAEWARAKGVSALPADSPHVPTWRSASSEKTTGPRPCGPRSQLSRTSTGRRG